MDKKKRPELMAVLSCLRDSEHVNMGISRNGKHFDLYGEAATLKDLYVLNGYFVDSIGRAPLQGVEIEISKDVQNNDDAAENMDDDHIRFGDVVGMTSSRTDDVTIGIIIDIRDGNAAILYQDKFDKRLAVAYRLLDDLKRLKITYSELSEDVMDWLAN